MKKKKKQKKSVKILYFLIFSFFLGFIYTLLVYQGIWGKITGGLSDIPIWAYPLWILFSFYLTLTLHELGHFFSFIFQKVNVRAIYITIFIFHKTEKGWRLSINPKLWILLGGLVVPDLGEIKDEETYQKKLKAFANSLLAAPIVTIVFLILSVISTILLTIFSNNETLIGIFVLNTLFIALLSTIYIYTFKLSNPLFYGDFVAYKHMKENEVFQHGQICQYTVFSLNESSETEKFLFEKTNRILEKLEINNTLFHTLLVTQYIETILSGEYEINPIIDQKLRKLNIQSYLRNEHGFMLANDLAFYFYTYKDVEKAYQIILQVYHKEYPKLNEKLVKYMRNKSFHLLHLEDQSEFLKVKENIYIGAIWIFDRLIDPYEDIDTQHQPLPYVPYVCEVHLEEQEEENKKSEPVA
jgi:hypothetical protein